MPVDRHSAGPLNPRFPNLADGAGVAAAIGCAVALSLALVANAGCGGSGSERSLEAGPPDAVRSTVVLDQAVIEADGVDAVTLTVTVLDATGRAVVGALPVLSVTGTDNTVVQPGATNALGVATGSVRTTRAESKTVTVTVGATVLATQPVITAEPGSPAGLAFAVEPTDTVAGAAIVPTVEVRVLDASGNLVTGPTTSVTLALGANPGGVGVVLGGTTTRDAVDGVASFPGLTLDKVGTGYTLTASSTAPVRGDESVAFAIAHGPVDHLVYRVQPSDVEASRLIAPFEVAFVDAFDNLVASSNDVVTVALAANPGGAFLGGLQPVTASGGIASFPDFVVTVAGNGYTLLATSTVATGIVSDPFDVSITSVEDGIGHADGPLTSFVRGAPNDAPGPNGLSSPGAMALDPLSHHLFVADTDNHRVLVFQLSAADDFAGVDRAADLALGQPDLSTNAPATTASGMRAPKGVAVDAPGQRLFVADTENHRVLVFDTASLATGMAASHALGQADLASSAPGTAAASLDSPSAVAFDATGVLFVADTGNHRVLAFDASALATGQPAQAVLGQPDLATSGPSTTTAGLAGPRGLAVDDAGRLLFVADTDNHRVTVFDVAAVVNGEDAIAVLGQPDFVSASSTLSSAGLSAPLHPAYDPATTGLFIADFGNRRVVRFDVAALTTGMSASVAYGQADLVSAVESVTAIGMARPAAALVSGTRLHVADGAAHRVTIHDAAAIASGAPALDGLGHLDAGLMDLTRSNRDDAPSAATLAVPTDAVMDIGRARLYVADSGNHRVLGYDLSSASDFVGVDRAADLVLGQPDFVSAFPGASASAFEGPEGVEYDEAHDRLFVSDTANHRVLVFAAASTLANGAAASAVLGQADLVSDAPGAGAAGLTGPTFLCYDPANDRLFVSDTGNHRVLVYDTAVIVDGEDAIAVLGQADFAGTSAATSASRLSAPRGLALDAASNRLLVADSGNHRCLSFPVGALASGVAATRVLGQPDFDTAVPKAGIFGVRSPAGIDFDPLRRFIHIMDAGNHRVVTFGGTNLQPTVPFIALGAQFDYGATAPGTGPTAIRSAAGIFVDPFERNFFIVDTGNSRVAFVDLP